MGDIPNHGDFWRNYWSNQHNGGHRHSDETFLLKEAREKLFHLNGGKILLDFGCGSADLLKYYIPYYDVVIGADFSQSMLDQAKVNIGRIYNDEIVVKQDINIELQDDDQTPRESKRVYLVLSDDKAIWEVVTSGVDRITTCGVLEFFSTEQFDNFLSEASNKLNIEGKVILFDVVHSNEYPLWISGFLSNGFSMRNIFRYMIYEVMGFYRQTMGRPKDMIGNSFHPDTIECIANKYGFRTEFVQSMYYEYRYHAILTKMESQEDLRVPSGL